MKALKLVFRLGELVLLIHALLFAKKFGEASEEAEDLKERSKDGQAFVQADHQFAIRETRISLLMWGGELCRAARLSSLPSQITPG